MDKGSFLRHFGLSFIVSGLLPILGTTAVLIFGFIWEKYSHGGTIPNDQDTQSDLKYDIWGAMLGLVFGIALIVLNVHPILLFV